MSRAARNALVEGVLGYARRAGDVLRTACPFCAEEGHKDKKQSLAIRNDSGVWWCYRCGTKGRLDGYDEDRAREAANKPAAEIVQFEPPPGFTCLADEPARSSEYYADARAYLQERKVKRSVIKRAHIGVSQEERWNGRIIIPFIEGETWVGWVGRLWTSKVDKDAQGLSGMKYLYPPGMSRGQILYNSQVLKRETDDPILVVEGAFDVLPFLTDAVAALGKLSGDQLRMLFESKRPVCFVPDGDEWQSAWAQALKFRFDGKRAGYIRLPPRVDPDEVDPVWLMDEARKSLDASI
jgi:DNA primase